ncbi:hypothetical protein ABPG72_016616 [Tetrahymena utriculariae]
MIKYLLFAFLVLSSIYCDCSSHSTTTVCTSDNNCEWKPDTTKDQCNNVELNCGGKPKADCKGTCTYKDEVKGACSPQDKYCGNIGESFCKTSSVCNFTPGSEVCSNKKNGYGCGSLLSEVACTAADKTYCSALGTCATPSSSKCDTTDPTACQANNACNYQEIKKEGCFTSDLYCSDSACEAKDPFCILKISNEKCAEKDLGYSCRLEYDDEPSCKADQNCEWDSNYDLCEQKECDQFVSQSDCESKNYCGWAFDSTCTPDQTKCPSNSSKNDCEAIPMTPGSSTIFPPCFFQDLLFTCGDKDFSKCSSYTDKKTCTDGGCQFTFTSCIDGDAQCGSKPIADCETKYSATCQKSNLPGTCTDKVGQCDSYPDSGTCGMNNCSWSNATPASCTNTVSCKKLDQKSCTSDTTNCSWVTGGTCISKTFDDVKNEALNQKILQITLLAIISFLMI